MSEDLEGVVTRWSDEDGWGVIDSVATPGGCFAHYAQLNMLGYHTVAVGSKVTFGAIPMAIEGLHWQATSVTPA